jgi:hypothetical protein
MISGSLEKAAYGPFSDSSFSPPAKGATFADCRAKSFKVHGKSDRPAEPRIIPDPLSMNNSGGLRSATTPQFGNGRKLQSPNLAAATPHV